MYAESYIRSSRHVRAIIAELVQNRLLPTIWEMTVNATPIDILVINFAYGLDFVAAFIFGLSRGTDFLRERASFQVWLDDYRKSHPAEYMFWLLEHPRLTRLLAKLHIFIVPKWYHMADTDFDKWGAKLVDDVEQVLQNGFTEEAAQSGEMPHVYFQQKRAMAEELKLEQGAYFKPTPEQRLELASECLDHLGKCLLTRILLLFSLMARFVQLRHATHSVWPSLSSCWSSPSIPMLKLASVMNSALSRVQCGTRQQIAPLSLPYPMLPSSRNCHTYGL